MIGCMRTCKAIPSSTVYQCSRMMQRCIITRSCSLDRLFDNITTYEICGPNGRDQKQNKPIRLLPFKPENLVCILGGIKKFSGVTTACYPGASGLNHWTVSPVNWGCDPIKVVVVIEGSQKRMLSS